MFSRTIESWFLVLSSPGFLGTRGPMFSDLVLVSLALVVTLLLGGMVLSRAGRHGLHAVTMSGTWLILALVVGAFVIWNGQGGPPAAPRLESASWYRTVYLPLLATHIAVALLSLAAAPAVAALGAVHRLRPKWGACIAPLARRHAFLGRWTFGFLLFTAKSGIAIYCLRYIY